MLLSPQHNGISSTVAQMSLFLVSSDFGTLGQFAPGLGKDWHPTSTSLRELGTTLIDSWSVWYGHLTGETYIPSHLGH